MAELQAITGANPQPAPTGEAIRIALVNSMADAALAITEQRFTRLMQACFPDRRINLRLITLPEIPRGELAAARIAHRYEPSVALLATPPDLVIFSGAEPLAANPTGESFWPSLQTLFDWVRETNRPTIFSCFAAHAAAHYFAGVHRRRLPQKSLGIFAQRSLLPEVPVTNVAHSRWHEVIPADLHAAGYRVLAAGPECGVDMFMPADNTPHLYLQGHPEYEAGALDLEYRRDLRRYLLGENQVSPTAQPQPPQPGGAEGAAPWVGVKAVLEAMLPRAACAGP